MHKDLLSRLRCPKDGSDLHENDLGLVCAHGDVFPIVQEIPVLLLNDNDPTLWVAKASFSAAREANRRPTNDMYLDTLGITDQEREAIKEMPKGPVDPVVSMIIPATSGNLYSSRQGKFRAYPIPELPLPPVGNRTSFLDIGCNWGRWCIAASKKGYRVVGIDPSLGAVLAAKRVASAMEVEADFVVADARRLPFAANAFDVVFSYSVLQHFSRENVIRTLDEINRVLALGGNSMIQMPNATGLWNLYKQARRRFSEADSFGVRYWRTAELERAFEQAIGPTTISVDGYFGLGIQSANVEHFRVAHRLVCYASDVLRLLSRRVPAMKYVADSLYVTSRSRAN